MQPGEVLDRLNRYIKSNNIEKTWIADQTGYTRQTIYQIFGGHQRMTVEFYLKVCELLNVSPLAFIADPNSQSEKEAKMRETISRLTEDNKKLYDLQLRLTEELLSERKKNSMT